jgi:hypothetical protein
MRLMRSVVLGAVLLLPALATRGAVTPPCPVPQSPRNINPSTAPYHGPSDHSVVVSMTPSQDEVRYKSREAGAVIETLYRCSQHYHVPAEDVQGCAGESEVITPPGTPPARVPGPGQWVGVHTAYASNRPPVPCPNPESLDCCTGTVLVLGFNARVTAGGANGPILTPAGNRRAEWSGSNTGSDKDPGGPTSCKETRAAWSFRLSCDFTLSQAQLGTRLPGGPQAARPLQGGPRISRDLLLVTLR